MALPFPGRVRNHIVTIDICMLLIQCICSVWHAESPFVRDLGHMVSINNWFVHSMKSQDVGSAKSSTRMEDDHPP